MLHGDCEKLDPRIRRTRGLLQDALRRLLEEKEFDKITIQDITEAATLNRATFYAHYPDKFALLEELIRVSFLQLLDCRKIRFDGSCATAFHPIILAVCDYLAELQKSNSAKQRQFEAFVEGTVIDQIRVILMDGSQKHPVERSIPPEMIAAAASWAIYGAVKQWVNTPEHIPAEEFVVIAANLVQPIIMAGVVSTPNP
jgi:AcrR family transcriptional regulator